MKISVHRDHTTLQLELKTTQVQVYCNYIFQSATPMQLNFITTMI
jgi:hypothetical protein